MSSCMNPYRWLQSHVCLGFWFSCCDCIFDCVKLYYQHFCGYRPSTALHTNLNSSFAAIECLQRPGGSHEGVGRKKSRRSGESSRRSRRKSKGRNLTIWRRLARTLKWRWHLQRRRNLSRTWNLQRTRNLWRTDVESVKRCRALRTSPRGARPANPWTARIPRICTVWSMVSVCMDAYECMPVCVSLFVHLCMYAFSM